jgi:hypothetical protein
VAKKDNPRTYNNNNNNNTVRPTYSVKLVNELDGRFVIRLVTQRFHMEALSEIEKYSLCFPPKPQTGFV